MKNYRFLLLLLLLASSWLGACRKEDVPECPSDLPCATQVGANTFGCYINGEPWVAGKALYIWDPTIHPTNSNYDEPGYGQDFRHQFYVGASYYDSLTNGIMSLYLWPVTGVGVLTPENSTLSVYANIGEINPDKLKWAFDIDSIANYEVNITHFDTENNIISGTFYYSGIDGTDTISVADGRFDVKYYPF